MLAEGGGDAKDASCPVALTEMIASNISGNLGWYQFVIASQW